MTYEPRPGSWSYRAIAHLETLPRGHELTLSALAEAIGGNGATLQQFIAPALDAGVIVRRLKHGQPRPYWYSLAKRLELPDLAPPPAPAAAAEEAPVQPAAEPAPSATPCGCATPSLRCALWSDGTLQIQRNAADLVLFTRDEVRQLVGYLDAIAHDAPQAVAAA